MVKASAPPLLAPSPVRSLGLPALLALGINGIVGVGIFFAPSELARLVSGRWSAVVFLVTALLLAPVAWVFGRLGARYAEDGGPAVWARAAFGERAAFGVGVVAYASAVLSTSAVLRGLGQYLAPEIGISSLPGRLAFQIAGALVLSAIVLFGLRPSALLWSCLTILKLVPLALLVLLWLWLPPASNREAPAAVEGPTLALFARAALVAVFPLQGFEIVPVPAKEARSSHTTVFAATLGSLGFSAVLYVLLQLACVSALPRLADAAAPIVEAGRSLGGDGYRAFFAAGTNISALGIAFGMFAMTPRYLAALGTEPLLGVWLAKERRSVPFNALFVTCAIVIVLVSSASLSELFVVSSLAVLTQYAVSALALFKLAWHRQRGLTALDCFIAPLTLLSVAMLASSAELAEALILALILLAAFASLVLRHRLRSARG